MNLRAKVLLMMLLLMLPADVYAFNCSVTSTPVGFGGYDVFSSAPLDAVGTITLSCNNPPQRPLPVRIAISSGQSGAFNPRQMRRTGGADRLNYYLFLDASKTAIWGDGTGGSSTFTGTITRNYNINTSVYGRVPPKQDIRAGSYGDNLVVTVFW